jgi:hypothetical protein
MTVNELKNKKITMATLKSFIRKSENLFIENRSSFDGMTDCVVDLKSELIPIAKEKAIGFNGVYCVGSGRDSFKFVETETHFGIRVSNCCGCSYLYTKKN